MNWHKDLLTLEKKNETHKTAIEAVDKYVVDFGRFNNVAGRACAVACSIGIVQFDLLLYIYT